MLCCIREEGIFKDIGNMRKFYSVIELNREQMLSSPAAQSAKIYRNVSL